jgi:RNA polymerase sigma factor (sigma-70 family)
VSRNQDRTVIERTNDEWLMALSSPGTARDEALSDLRVILFGGLQRGLLGRVDTSAPEFHTLAEDFVQEALLRVLDNLQSFAGRSKFTTWAHKIAVHIALTELRRKRWQDASLDHLTASDDGDYTPSYTADPEPTPEISLARSEMLARVNRIIEEELTSKQRQVVLLSVLQDEPAAVVARTMGTNPNAVYKLLHDARLNIKSRLAEEGLSSTEIMAVFD